VFVIIIIVNIYKWEYVLELSAKQGHNKFNIIHTVPFLPSLFLKTNKKHQLKYSKTDHKTHFISGTNSCMFRYQSAIIREFINNRIRRFITSRGICPHCCHCDSSVYMCLMMCNPEFLTFKTFNSYDGSVGE
jgi:hypothetical protein